jgi:hypothetical protein
MEKLEAIQKESERTEQPTVGALDLADLSGREASIISAIRGLALGIEQNDEDSLSKYYEIGRLVDRIHNSTLDYRTLATRIGVLGFSHSTLDKTVLFYNDVHGSFHDEVKEFIQAFQTDPWNVDNSGERPSLAWRNIHHYVSRPRPEPGQPSTVPGGSATPEAIERAEQTQRPSGVSRVKREQDVWGEHSMFKDCLDKISELSSELRRLGDDLPDNLRIQARPELKQVYHDVKVVLRLEQPPVD